MTPEERAAYIVRGIEYPLRTAIIAAIHEGVTQAYEEAAKVAESAFSPDDGMARAYAVGDHIAISIRALKP